MQIKLEGSMDMKLGLVMDKTAGPPCVVGKVTGGMAAQAKMQPGWQLLAVNGQSVEALSYEPMMEQLKVAAKSRPIALTLLRRPGAAPAAPARAPAAASKHRQV